MRSALKMCDPQKRKCFERNVDEAFLLCLYFLFNLKLGEKITETKLKAGYGKQALIHGIGHKSLISQSSVAIMS